MERTLEEPKIEDLDHIGSSVEEQEGTGVVVAPGTEEDTVAEVDMAEQAFAGIRKEMLA